MLARITDCDEVYLSRRWSTQGGHLYARIKGVAGVPAPKTSDGILLCTGRGDFVLPVPAELDKPLNSYELMRRTCDQIRPGAAIDQARLHLTGFFTTVGHPLERIGPLDSSGKPTPLADVDQAHPQPAEVLARLAASRRLPLCVTSIKTSVFDHLKKLRMPKVVAERFLGMFSLLAQGLDDQFLLAYMLELLPYMMRVRDSIPDYWQHLQAQNVDLSKYLSSVADEFELAWSNRFKAGWHLGELSDYSMGHKGGIQQLVSAFDAAYEALCERMTGTDGVIALVTGDPGMSSTEAAIRLNFYDVYSSELFAARVAHEAAEQVLNDYSETSFLVKKLHTDYRELRMSTRASGERHPDNSRAVSELARESFWVRLSHPARCREMLELLRMLRWEQLFADICMYRTTYFRDPVLYGYWCLNSFVVEYNHWQRCAGQQVDERYLKLALLRLALVMASAGNSPEASNYNGRVTEGVGNLWAELPSSTVNVKAFFADAMTFAAAVRSGQYFRQPILSTFLHQADTWAECELLPSRMLDQYKRDAADKLNLLRQGVVPAFDQIEPRPNEPDMLSASALTRLGSGTQSR